MIKVGGIQNTQVLWQVNEVIKVGGIQNTQVLWQAVFLAASPLASGGSAAKILFRECYNTASYAGYIARHFSKINAVIQIVT